LALCIESHPHSNEFHDSYSSYNAVMAPTPVKPIPVPTSVEIPKVEPGRDEFADHPHIDIKTQGRAPMPPMPIEPEVRIDEDAQAHVGEGKTVAHEPEVVPTVEREVDMPKVSVTPDTEVDEVPQKAEPAPQAVPKAAPPPPAPAAGDPRVAAHHQEHEPAPPAPVAEAIPLPAEDMEADRVAQALYSEENQ
jgi:hypothetical protein